jgi:uncharacterized protein (TIGR02996 family)
MRPEQERAFWEAIQEAPEDDTPRLVYADWCEDHGQPERAEFIRAQIELEGLAVGDPRRAALEDRADDLLARHEMDWLGPAEDLSDWEWQRGFVERVSVPPSPTLEPARHQFERHPVRRAGFGSVSGTLDRLRESPFLERLEGLALDAKGESDRAALLSILRSSRLARLADLDLASGETDGLLADLADLPVVPALRMAHITRLTPRDTYTVIHGRNFSALNDVGGFRGMAAPALGMLLQTPARWAGLRLGYADMRAENLAGLAKCESLHRLEFRWPNGHEAALPLPRSLERLSILSVRESGPSPGACAETVRGLPLRRLKYRWCPPPTAGSREDWERLGELLSQLPGPVLDLDLVHFAEDPLPALVCLPGLGSIRRLYLSMNPVSDAGVDALASCAHFVGLRELEAEVAWSQEQVERLASAPWLAGLRKFSLNGPNVGDKAAAILLSSSGFRRLRMLELVRAGISLATIEALQAWPHLPGLRRLSLSLNGLPAGAVEPFRALLGRRVYGYGG